MSGHVAIIGGGPAGLAAAERLSGAGRRVVVYEAMPTPARKFLMAGKSGLNITHSEPFAAFAGRFGPAGARLLPALLDFPPDAIRDWAAGLGVETFIGSSGRIFPAGMKASPLLRAWLARLGRQGVELRLRHRFTGLAEDGGFRFETPQGVFIENGADAVLLALGGPSWPRLGSDGSWLALLAARGVCTAAFRPANCGFDIGWSAHFIARFAGAPVKAVAATSDAGRIEGEFVISRHGIEGSLVYAHAAALRDLLADKGSATLQLDLVPGRDLSRLAGDLARQDGKASLANRLRKGAGLQGVKAALPREVAPQSARLAPDALAGLLKALPLAVLRPRLIAEAISAAGGVCFDSVDDNYMLKTLPGVFCAGEMLDWEAPTGGYLLSACLASGRAAAKGIENWLSRR